ncbi:MAG: hypothetical protein GY846_02090 [Deltaproteobacteria bacterium]|nr:hypothetical protein [Deltaproteobacteria bacterium]
MEQVRVNLGEWFEKGFRLYRENILKLVPVTFVALILSVASVGILAGAMLSGVLIINLALLRRQHPKPVFFHIFNGFRFFINSLVFVLGWGLLICAGSLILLRIPGIGQLVVLFFIYSAQAFLMFGPFLIVDQDMDFFHATITSFNTVKRNFWPFLSVSAVAGVIGSIGCIAFGIGVIVTVPIQVCILTVAYEAVFAETLSVN